MLLLDGIESDLLGCVKDCRKHCLMSWSFAEAMQASQLA